MCFGSVLRIACMVGSGLCTIGNQATKLMKQDVKLAYGILVLFYSLFLMLVLYFLAPYLKFANSFIGCPSGNDNELNTCLGMSAVYRMSFVLAIVHILVGLSCLTRDKFAKIVNEGLWGFKMILTAGGFFGTLFMSNDFFNTYAKVSIYLSGMFLFVQAVSLIDGFYLWASFWAKKYDDGNGCYGCLLIFTSLLQYALIGFFVYHGFTHFWQPGCSGNKFMLITPVFFTIFFIILIVLRFHPNGSVLTSGAISIFGVYLFWATLVSNTNTTCNNQYSSGSAMLLQIFFSFFFAFSCNIYWALITQSSVAYKQAQLPDVAATDGDNEIAEKTEKENEAKEGNQNTNLIRRDDTAEQYVEYENNSYIKFHGFMILFSVYICAVFSNWGHATINGQSYNYKGDSSNAPYYIKATTAVFTFGLYLWTVVAPTLFPDRDFNS
jgi:serine incorporator 1/3